MTGTPTTEEQVLRDRLADAALALRTAMNRIPDPTVASESSDAMESALDALCEAERASDALAALGGDLTLEAALLARSSAASLAMCRHALTLLFAELDSAA